MKEKESEKYRGLKNNNRLKKKAVGMVTNFLNKK